MFCSSEFILSEVADVHSKILSSSSNEDDLGQIWPESTEVLNLHSDGEVSTTVDSKEPVEKSKYSL